ncbi:MAG: protein RarD [Dethiosulfovibrio peptidovorans]|nr:MAG: protein RarD [Dethiosulfovibrio peptidovorans]
MDTAYKGGIAATVAVVLWGLLPIYWRQIAHVPAYEILCHRIIWALLVTAALLGGSRQWGLVREALKNRKSRWLLLLSGMVIGCNWLIYIWSVNHGYVLQCSLGYFINPLMYVCLGALFFQDKLRPAQWFSVGIATAGVLYQVLLQGQVPWIGLGLACSFTVYGCIRKIVAVESLPGLFVETSFLAVPAGAFLIWTETHGQGTFIGGGLRTSLFLAGSGVVTSVPLLWFVQGARALSMVTTGLLQYIAPSIQFILGYWVYKETFTEPQLVTFGAIWIALALYTADKLRQHRSKIQTLGNP